ncbi:MAG: hypothetical protein KDB01_20160, partial [Planctomycetaceae bacterium]|nr:hypothetical protein [Planctomycetaceae bacterium]
MASEVLKQRLILSLKCLVNADPSLFNHWRGGGDGTSSRDPCIAIVQYARSSDVGDPFLKQILDAILKDKPFPGEIGHSGSLDLAGIGEALGLGDHHHQFANLIRGIVWTVDAEYFRRLALNADNDGQAQQAYVSLKRAAACYDAAWRLSTKKVTGTGLDPIVAPDPVQNFMRKSRSVMTDVTYSTWNILHRLLNVLWPVEPAHAQPLPDPGNNGHNNLLTVLFYEEQSNRGVLGPMRVCLAAADYPTVVPDPLKFGITILDDALQQSMRAGYRCCRTRLLSQGDRRFPAIYILPEFPVRKGINFSTLSGASAGGLLAAGMIITADGQKVDRRRTTTCSIPAIAGDDETELKASDVLLAAVGGVPQKMFAVREPLYSLDWRISRVALVAANKEQWEKHNAYSENPIVEEVATLGELVRFLRGDTVCEEQLDLHAARVHQEWDRIVDAGSSTAAKVSDHKQYETHRFDCFVPPRFQVEGPLRRVDPRSADPDDEEFDEGWTESSRDPQQLRDTEQTLNFARRRLEVPGTGNEALLALLKLSLLKHQDHQWDAQADWLEPGKSLVLYDRAGAGKTVTTFRLKHVLTSPKAREVLFKGSAPLVVRIEGSWPTDAHGKPFATVRQV